MGQYELRPLGHQAAAMPRPYVQSGNDLVERCLEWYAGKYEAGSSSWLEGAKTILTGVKIDREEIPALLYHGKVAADPRYDTIGLFLSALYDDCVDDQVIVYREDTPWLSHVGMASKKIFVNRGQLGNFTGSASSGIVINVESVEESFGNFSSGLTINAGRSAGHAGHFLRDGIFVNLGITGKNLAERADGYLLLADVPADIGTQSGSKIFGEESAEAMRFSRELVECAKKSPEDLVQYGTPEEIIAKMKRLLGVDG
jgi:hypothetical protein